MLVCGEEQCVVSVLRDGLMPRMKALPPVTTDACPLLQFPFRDTRCEEFMTAVCKDCRYGHIPLLHDLAHIAWTCYLCPSTEKVFESSGTQHVCTPYKSRLALS